MKKPLLGLAALTLALAGPAPHAAADSLPYTDPAVSGSLTLCDAHDQPITGGSTADAPFAAKTVSSAAAPTPYDAPGATATVFAYQPRGGVLAGDWSGYQMNGPSRFADPAHPTSISTGGDASIGDLLGEYPTMVDGLMQLRLFLGAPGAPTRTTRYSAVDIRVTGGTWVVVDGGHDSCAATGVAAETVLLPAAQLTPSAAASLAPGATTAAAAGGSTPPPAGAAASGPGTTTAAGAPLAGPAARDGLTDTAGTSVGRLWGEVAALGATAAATGAIAGASRRRRRTQAFT